MVLYKLITTNKMEQLDRYGYVGEFNYYSNHQFLMNETSNLCDEIDESNQYEKLMIIKQLINIVINPFNDIKTYMFNYHDNNHNDKYIFNNKYIMIYYKLYTYSNNIKIFLEQINCYDYFNSIVKELFDGKLMEYIHNYLVELKEDCDNFREKIIETKTTDMTKYDIKIYEEIKISSTNILRLIYNDENKNRNDDQMRIFFSKFNLINEYSGVSKYNINTACEKTRHIYSIIDGVKHEKNYCSPSPKLRRSQDFRQYVEKIAETKLKLKEKVNEIINKVKIFIDEVKKIVGFDIIQEQEKQLALQKEQEQLRINKFTPLKI